MLKTDDKLLDPEPFPLWRWEIPIPKKLSVSLLAPNNLNEQDWDVVDMAVRALLKRRLALGESNE